MVRAYYTLKIGFVLLLLLDNRRLVSGPPIYAQFSQAFAKTASRNQLDWTIVLRGQVPIIKGYSGMSDHALNFDGSLWQNFANQRNRFYFESPPVCTILAIKRPILKI
jgi:hypothetical protein